MSKSAELYRMATDEHICPFGLKSKDLLEREGYDVNDHLLDFPAFTRQFLTQNSTLPQI